MGYKSGGMPNGVAQFQPHPSGAADTGGKSWQIQE